MKSSLSSLKFWHNFCKVIVSNSGLMAIVTLRVKILSEVDMEFIIILFVLLAAVAAFIVTRFIHHGNPFPFTKRGQLFTQVERSFLTLLKKEVGDKYKIINNKVNIIKSFKVPTIPIYNSKKIYICLPIFSYYINK